MSRFDSTTFLTGLLVGSAAGAVAGLLYAPKPGAALNAMRHPNALDTEGPRVDEEIDQSFPASDPPSWTSATSTTDR